ncbi:MAG: UDP-3-O-(3-hydroxymyristoyl)glucosamine N-acyltransferase [Pyrinomonadaceae bacterium]|nr:UDP-3-O-(3-hydroxymyristoyl)glucosamine N-acyltransferase [Pyrinomonadaceae bacterium]
MTDPMSDTVRAKSVEELAALIGARALGDTQIGIESVASVGSATLGTVAFVEDLKALENAQDCGASALIVPDGAGERARKIAQKVPAIIEVAIPKLAFALFAKILHPQKQREPSIHSTAAIAESADIALTAYIGPHVSIGENSTIGTGTRIEAGVVVGDDVTIGIDCVLHPNVTLYDGVTIGDRVVLHAAVCIGADGFGYVRDDVAYHKFPQVGTVIIEDDVEIGAHTCVDRGSLGRTRIGRGTKLDNQIHVGHNCDIGERVVIAAQTGISGSVTIEDDCVIGGQVGFGDHIRVQSGAVIGSKAGVLPGKIVRPGVWWGIPIQPRDEYKRLNAHVGRLPQMREELKELRTRVKELEEKLLPNSADD